MPKPQPEPPPSSDEPRYLTVHKPYPLHANMDIEADRMAFVYWIASCIGREYLFAFFHKPKSPNMVIIEVNRYLSDFNSLLGEHRWLEFLRAPTAQEKKLKSGIFYCTYSTCREVEKYGWKRIDVEDKWFISREHVKWHRINEVIVYPYPKTHRCSPPPEDPTREKLCRPLPSASFPPPPPPTRPPKVGSPQWIREKQAPKRATSPAIQECVEIPRSNVARNLTGWAVDMSGSVGNSSLPPGLIPLVPSTPTSTKSTTIAWTMAPPGLVRNSSGSGLSARSNGSDPSEPATPQDDVAGIADMAGPRDLGQDDEDEDEDEFAGGPTTASAVQQDVDVKSLEEAQRDLWDKDSKPTGAGGQVEVVFKCSIHLTQRCKRQLCQEHAKWYRAQERLRLAKKRKEERASAPSKNRKGGQTGSRKDIGGSWRNNNNGSRGAATGANATPLGQREPAPHLPSRSGSSSPDCERSSPSSHSQSSDSRPMPAGLRAGSGNAAKSPPPRPVNLRKGGSANDKSGSPIRTAPPLPPNLRKGSLAASQAGAPTKAAPPPPAGLRKNGNGVNAAAPPPPLDLSKGAAAPADDDARSEVASEWNPSVGMWGSVAGSRAPSVRDDVRSVTGWSTASRGEDMWGNDDDDAVSVASTVAAAVPQARPANGGGNGNGIGNGTGKGKRKSKAKNQNQVQNKNKNDAKNNVKANENKGQAAAPVKKSWADMVEEEDNRSVANSEWGSVPDMPW